MSAAVVVVDSGGANLASVLFALERLGATAQLSADPQVIAAAPRVLLPGVGAAGAVMANLRQRQLVDCLRALTQPVLGICLGMQILYESSAEGNCQCLGILPGRVTPLQPAPDRPVPHMGWNRVRAVQDSRLLPLQGVGAALGDHFYFVHSYAAPMGAAVVAVADYGVEVPALVQHGNWLGAQFHPERSGAAGARLLQRFLEL